MENSESPFYSMTLTSFVSYPDDVWLTNAPGFSRYNAFMFDRVDPLTAKTRLENGAVLIDVREQDEFDQVRVPGATLIPLSEFATRFTEMPKDQEVVLMCAGGIRSAQAAQFAAQHGFKLTNLEGGISAWHAEGLPVEFGGAS